MLYISNIQLLYSSLIIMKKVRNLVLWGILLTGGISLGIMSKNTIMSPAVRVGVFGMCFAGGRIISATLWNKRDAKRDELTKKAWYISLALSCQIALFVWCMILLVNAFYPFLEDYTAFFSLILTINGMVLVTVIAYVYYMNNPDKIWLQEKSLSWYRDYRC